MTEVLVILIVVAAAAAVAYPALRQGGASREPGPSTPSPAEEGPSEEERLLEKKARVLGALREIEADREAGNVSEEDYARLKREYEAEAAAVLRQLDAVEGPLTAPGAPALRPMPARRGLSPALGWGFGIILFGVLVGALLTQAIRPRGPDGSITGNEPAEGGGGGGGGGMGGPLMPVDESRIGELEARVAADSTDVDALNELGHLYISTQQFREAADVSMRALRADPQDAQAMTHLGVVLWANGELDPALEAFNHSIQFDPDWHEAYLFKGLVLFTAKRDFPGAVEAWERYLEVAPPDANTDRVRGMLEGARRAATTGESR